MLCLFQDFIQYYQSSSYRNKEGRFLTQWYVCQRQKIVSQGFLKPQPKQNLPVFRQTGTALRRVWQGRNQLWKGGGNWISRVASVPETQWCSLCPKVNSREMVCFIEEAAIRQETFIQCKRNLCVCCANFQEACYIWFFWIL